MREEWKNFWRQWAKRLWHVPLGPLIAFGFLLMAFPQWLRGGMRLTGLMISAVYGLAIPIMIALCFAAAYGARLQIELKTGYSFKVSTPINILIDVVGLAMGVLLGMTITRATLGQTATGVQFLISMIFGGWVIVAFSFYFAYKRAKEEALALREKLRAFETGLAERDGGRRYIRRLAVKQGVKLRVVETEDVFCFVSRDHYTLVYFRDGQNQYEAICDLSITRLDELLDPAVYQRLHRNSIARISAMVALSRSGQDELMAELSNGMKLPVSRSRRKILREALRKVADTAPRGVLKE